MNVIRRMFIRATGSFARASTKLCMGANGLLQTVPVDVPAWQYDPLNLNAAPVALLEGRATNLLLQSNRFDLGPWATGPTAGRLLPNAALDPYGSTTAALILKDDVGGYCYQQPAIEAGIHTLSIFVKRVVAAPYVFLQFDTGWRALFDLSSETFTVTAAASEVTCAKFNLRSGWVRISIAATLPDIPLPRAGSCAFGLCSATGDIAAPDYAASEGHFFWAPQLERGPVATSPIHTTSVQVAREADIITGTGLIWSNAVEAAPAYSPATTYALDEKVSDPVAHKVYQSLIGGNTGNALTDETKWFDDDVSTNPFAAFDDMVGTATTTAGPLLMLVVAGPIDSIGLKNVVANSCTIAITDPTSMTNAFSKTTDLANDAGITDYDAYFFDDDDTVSSVFTDSLPQYYGGIISLAFTGPAAVSLGVAVFGNAFDLGASRYGLRVGFISYTTKVTDKRGRLSVDKGPTSDRMSVSTMIDNGRLSKTVAVMRELDGVPTIYAGVEALFDCLIQFAFTKEFETEIAYPQNSLCSFQIEGLT